MFRGAASAGTQRRLPSQEHVIGLQARSDLGAFDGYGDAGTWVTLRDETTRAVLAQAHVPDAGSAGFSLSNFTAAGTYPIEVKRTLNEACCTALTIVTNYNYQP